MESEIRCTLAQELVFKLVLFYTIQNKLCSYLHSLLSNAMLTTMQFPTANNKVLLSYVILSYPLP